MDITLEVPNYSYRRTPTDVILTAKKAKKNVVSLPQIQVILPKEFEESQVTFLQFSKKASHKTRWFPIKRGFNETISIEVTAKDYFGLLRKTRRFQLEIASTTLPRSKTGETALVTNQLRKIGYTEPSAQKSFDIRNYRTYQYGDSLNRVDWKLSARSQELILREFEPEPTTQQTLCFWGEEAERFEQALDLTFSIAQHWTTAKNFHLLLLGDTTYAGGYQQEAFATIQAGDAAHFLSQAQHITSNQLVLVAPEKTALLEETYTTLQKKNDVLLLCYEDTQLFSYYKNQRTPVHLEKVKP